MIIPMTLSNIWIVTVLFEAMFGKVLDYEKKLPKYINDVFFEESSAL